jgi:hypothetical protein
MDQLKKEITGNFEKFGSSWKKELDEVTGSLQKQNDRYFPSYVRVATLQAWRTLFLEHHIQSESLQFFLEAQNDAVTAHVLARMGAWRSSLKALRSCIENVYFCLYYKDHPVELQLWKSGKHKVGFSELHKYFESHPDFSILTLSATGLAIIKEEYSTLSKAVHGSAESFRMTVGTETTVIWTDDKGSLGKWLTREKATLCALNEVLLVMFKSNLSGAALPGLRKSISLVFSPAKRSAIKTALSVNLPAR